jgi:DNA-binding SARP family transcriptional activator
MPALVPRRGRRLLAFLALHGHVARPVVAGTLWPESTEQHALTSLRATSMEVRRAAPGVLGDATGLLSLTDCVCVDLHRVRSLLAGKTVEDPARTAMELCEVDELLPGWYEDWVLSEQERIQQALVIRLESLAWELLNNHDLEAARTAAAQCVRLEPLRESAVRLLAAVHLADGNRVQAWQVYDRFRRDSIREFGLAPDAAFDELMAPLLQERRSRSQRRR